MSFDREAWTRQLRDLVAIALLEGDVEDSIYCLDEWDRHRRALDRVQATPPDRRHRG